MKFNIIKKNRNKSGIYKIINRVNNKVYIGKTKNFYKRYRKYNYAIKNRLTKHVNEYMLNSILKYGIDNFRFEIIEIIHPKKDQKYISKREIYWMDMHDSLNRKKGYNLIRDSEKGLIVHPSTLLKISNNMKEQWKSGVRKNHSEKLKINWKDNIERRKQQSELFKKKNTIYSYDVSKNGIFETCDYEKLIKLGLIRCLSSFSKKRSDNIIYKGYNIQRKRLKI
jgi:group I intron endonuclease